MRNGDLRWFRTYPVLRPMIVNTPDESFRGVLWAKRGDYLILRNAELLKPGGDTVPIDGDVLIPRRRINFIQLIG